MARILAVHGINNTYSSYEEMAAEWLPALLGGLSNAGRGGMMSAEDVAFVYYGNLFRRPGRYLGIEEMTSLDPECITDPAEVALLADWLAEAADNDPGVAPPGARTLGGVGVQDILLALSNSRFLAGASERLLLLWLNQVRAYFTRPELRTQIQKSFALAVGMDTRVVVGHSLGSVVAYEALAAHPNWPVNTLVTLGSPLGIPNIVLDRLQPIPARRGIVRMGRWPGGVTRWTNIADRHDFVALNKRLHEVFGPDLADVEIDNGVRMHQVKRYLSAAETGMAIARAFMSEGC